MIYIKYILSLTNYLQFLIVWILKLDRKQYKRIKKNFVFNFLKQIFTWWHKQTVGTFIYTLISGKLVGKDQFGNKYYGNSKGKRWVIYKNNVESSKIPPEWHLWIHSLTANKPNNEKKKYVWQKNHQENLTGTEKAYKPEGSLGSETKKKYEKI